MIPLYAESWDEEVGARVKDTRGGGGGGKCSRAGYVSLTHVKKRTRDARRARDVRGGEWPMGPPVPLLREYYVSMYLVLKCECRAMRDRWMNMLYRHKRVL